MMGGQLGAMPRHHFAHIALQRFDVRHEEVVTHRQRHVAPLP
jgi:hypothetical protein